jgi:hypothetical protein
MTGIIEDSKYKNRDIILGFDLTPYKDFARIARYFTFEVCSSNIYKWYYIEIYSDPRTIGDWNIFHPTLVATI